MNWLSKLFRRMTPLEAATQELYEAEMSLLKAFTGREWADSSVKYNTSRIARLRAYIQECSNATSTISN
jgi:hypothetical protein